jgi:uncharacterized protein (UPF0335 family)
MAKPYIASEEAQKVLDVEPIDVTRVHPDADKPVYRYRMKITKKGLLKYFSHLDWQNTFHKTLARSGLRMAFTLGFNPTMKVSMGIALPLFAESEGELVDIESEIKRLQGELKTVENEVARANGKLSNNGFLEKAPKSLVDAEREKRDKYDKCIIHGHSRVCARSARGALGGKRGAGPEHRWRRFTA